MTEPVLVAWSGGKDSALALQEILGAGRYRVAALLTTVTGEYDRISMHGVRRTLLHRQAESLGLPLEEVVISPSASNDEYEARMGAALGGLRAARIPGGARVCGLARPPERVRRSGIRRGLAARSPGRGRPVRREWRISHVRVRRAD